MIYDTSIKNKEIIRKMNLELGKAYSFFKSIKIGGTGSSKMLVEQCSHDMKQFLSKFQGANYASIELRPKGIIVHLKRNNTTHHSWAIPFHRLVIYNTEHFTIYEGGSYIRFNRSTFHLNNSKFISKLLDLKAKYWTDFKPEEELVF
ncbi:MAG: hypothetical protein KDC84_13620 [Crocinitomicaceae bacterium]|nr:hypothetical protein [Crocinitomicaceae bacterium]